MRKPPRNPLLNSVQVQAGNSCTRVRYIPPFPQSEGMGTLISIIDFDNFISIVGGGSLSLNP